MRALKWSFLKIKMKEWVSVNEVGIYLSLTKTKMVYVSLSYVVQEFFDEFLDYKVRYVFNYSAKCFIDLDLTFKQNHIVHSDILIYGR